MTVKLEGGINIAMKVPSHQYETTIAFYRDTVGLEPITEKAPAVGFKLGPNQLWIDEGATMSQAEVWLELFTPDSTGALRQLADAGVLRSDRTARRWLSRRLGHEPRQHRPYGARTGRVVTPREPQPKCWPEGAARWNCMKPPSPRSEC